MRVGFVVRVIVFAACAVVVYVLGDGVFRRMSQPQGIDLVAVDDAPRVQGPRPRHVVLVVVDGLGAIDAARVPAIESLARSWPCLHVDVGAISISRPGFATISTGLECDRNGCRSNSDTRPLAADSIWQEARRAGRRVVGASEIAWWTQLFPDGFDAYHVGRGDEDLFAPTELADLTLIHPGYVDDTAHESGTQGPEFAAALVRVDREIHELLTRIDLSVDTLIVTADHGHVARGGHGGRGARESFTRACFAGIGVKPGARGDEAPLTMIAPTISMLAGIPFPKTMRASSDGADGLDLAIDLLDARAAPAGWIDDRRAAIARFRAANPNRTAIELRAHRLQTFETIATVCVTIALIFLWIRARDKGASRIASIAASLGIVALFVTAFVALAFTNGALDLSSVKNASGPFVRASSLAVTVVVAVYVALHLALRRDVRALADDLLVAVCAGTFLSLAHVVVLGYHVDPPLPGARTLFFPVLDAIVVMVFVGSGLLATFTAAWRARRTPATSDPPDQR
jgi:hypothetical protein